MLAPSRESLHERLTATLRRALDTATAPPGARHLLRVETPMPGVEPLAWLHGQRGWTQYFWGSRDEAFEMAGIGEAHVTEPAGDTDFGALFEELRRVLPPGDGHVRHYGGFRFHKGPVKGPRWSRFKAYRFVVPRFEVCRRGAETHFAWTIGLEDGDDAGALTERMGKELARVSLAPETGEALLPAFGGRHDNPDAAAWTVLIDRTLAALDAHDLDKIVLARETCFQADAPIDPVALLLRLRAGQPHTHAFCFHPVADRAFLGASPELLFRRNGLEVQSEALAGTRPRHKDAAQDASLGEALLSSEKDLREHRIVVETILDQLRVHCVSVETPPPPQLMRLAHVQHLHTPIRGRLRDANADAALLEALHPTPAVGGAPRGPALDWIARHEPFDRGIYAAPVGWVGADAAEFCVAIRSGLVQNDVLTLYNGAGIVSGSAPEEEWAEIEYKMAGFLSVLSGDTLE